VVANTGQSTPAALYYVHNDHLGTPQALTNQAGVVVWKATYDPFGWATVNEDPDGDEAVIKNNVRYVGMYSDSETGLYYWGSRYYDPKTGRAISADRMSVAEHVRRWQANMGSPYRLPLEINPYVYVANNPLRWIDRTGRVIETWEPSSSITHDPIRWGLPQLPANGNLWPGSNPDQDWVCTAPAGIFNT
jgi:RHS repeat-associated protein